MAARTTTSARRNGGWVALLRGVNVGGRGRVPMSELRELFQSLGFDDVRTLIQSGNVIFHSTAKPSAAALESAISDRFRVTSPVLLRTSAQLAKIIERDPFGHADRVHVHVGFLQRSLSKEAIAALDVDRFAPERIEYVGTEVYFLLPGGMGNSKLASYVGRKIGDSMTVRNWNTVATLVELARA